MTIDFDDLPARELSTRRIYGYRFNLAELAGRIKVGETRRAVKARVKEQISTAGLADLVEIVFDQPAIDRDGRAFGDKDVHDVLKKMDGVNHLDTGGGSEWFECDVASLERAYSSVVEQRRVGAGRTLDHRLREEQKDAINKTLTYITNEWNRDNAVAPRFLWNAKMRFGKTLAAYHLAKEIGAKRVLVLTFKPAVAEAWQTDLETQLSFEGWTFQSSANVAGNAVVDLAEGEHLVHFSSFQDLLQLHEGQFKPKHQWLEETVWDLVIFDEYHYGAWRYAEAELVAGEERDGRAEMEATYTEAVNVMEEEQEEWGKDEREFLPFKKARAFLYLSGTPFRALASGYFQPDQIYNWTYTDEQAAKERWSAKEVEEKNPYAALPELRLLTYQMPDSIRAVAASGTRSEFDLNAFFKATGEGDTATFVHEDLVLSWLDWLRGQGPDAIRVALESQRKPMPYADARIREYLDHTVWFLPSVAAVYAMRNLLIGQGGRWGDYTVLAVAGNDVGSGREPLDHIVKPAIASGYDSKTITLTCGKLLTGVTVRQWASILMLCNLNSPETYFQAAFRVQSSWTIKNPDGDDPNFERIEKPTCLVIDFAPTRALRLYADYGVRLGAGSDPHQDLTDLARYLPVLAFEGATMRHIDAGEILDIALQSAAVDVRQMDSMKFINPRAGAVERLSTEVRAALGRVRATGHFSAPKIETIISDTPEVSGTSTTTSPPGGDDDGSNADDEQSLDANVLTKRLQFLSRRINAFMYLSTNHETTLEQVLSTKETELFRQVLELAPGDMKALVDAGLFNEAALRLAILQFSRAERDSLSFTGLDPWADGLPEDPPDE